MTRAKPLFNESGPLGPGSIIKGLLMEISLKRENEKNLWKVNHSSF